MILSFFASILGFFAALLALGKAHPNLKISAVAFSNRHKKSLKFFKLADEILEDVSQVFESSGGNKADARAHLPLIVGALKRCELMQRRRSFSIFVSAKRVQSYLNRLKAEERRLNSLPKFASYEEFMREVA